MGTFQKVNEFNEKLKRAAELFNWNIGVKEYKDLKKDPKAYCFYESENYIKFLAKNRKHNNEVYEFVMVIAFMDREQVMIRKIGINRESLEFMNKEMEHDQWWL